ncbi:DMT family transporter [Pseudonocardia sp. RS11V-5]|uniref:DMT family transporter n=1 Tax=Pseudonocardia terrae TaxID=2905831 RepID=UPI001E2E7E58|nr:DMT family transporter [Pseudonocardia terrae]MCE3551749.1 DMT family transporter [Pseudonocardia terrae]
MSRWADVAGLGLGAAVLLGLGFVLQQRAARARSVPDAAVSFRLLGDLIGTPMWLAGLAAMIAGQLLGAAALGVGDVTLVEPLLTTNLLFALLFTRALSVAPLRAEDWIGSVALVGGVVLFLVCAAPRQARNAAATHADPASAVFLGVVAVVVAVLVLLSRSRDGPTRAGMLALGAGLLFGVQDGLTRSVVGALGRGPDRLFASWPFYALVLVAITGILLMQNAFGSAPLRSSLPVITAAEPLTGIAFGLGVYGERIRLAPGWLVGAAAGLAVMIAGVVVVARSRTLHLHRGL